MRYDASEHRKGGIPFYMKLWFYVAALAGLLYAAASMAVPVMETMLEERYSAPVKVAYSWVDDDGVTHYSDAKKSPFAEEVVVIDTPKGERIKLIEAQVLIHARRYRPLLERVFFSLVLLGGAVFTGVAAVSLGRGLKRRHDAISFKGALRASLRDFADLEDSVSLSAEVSQFRDKLARARASFERCTRSSHAGGPYHGEVVWALGKALKVYEDCLTLWNVTSQRELTSDEMKDYLREYPALLDRTTGHGAPLPPEAVRRAVRRTLMRYASYYAGQARELHAKSGGLEPSA